MMEYGMHYRNFRLGILSCSSTIDDYAHLLMKRVNLIELMLSLSLSMDVHHSLNLLNLDSNTAARHYQNTIKKLYGFSKFQQWNLNLFNSFLYAIKTRNDSNKNNENACNYFNVDRLYITEITFGFNFLHNNFDQTTANFENLMIEIRLK